MAGSGDLSLVLAECSYNDKLSMFVYAAGRDAAGCFNAETQNDFYIEGGQTERAFTHVIAHELGHYFAARQTGRIPVPNGFKAAYLQDKARYDKGEAPHFLLKSLLEDVVTGESYDSDTAKLAEYFTRACVQFPIRLYLQDPNISAQNFAAILNKSMPYMFDYFQSKFIQKSSMVKAVPDSPELSFSN